MDYLNVLNQYRELLLAHFPNELQRLILFGSQARGEANTESDIDVLVLVNWEEQRLPNGRYVHPYGDPRWHTIINLAYDISLERDVVLSPLVMSNAHFEQWSPLTNAIKREGIEIWTRKQP